MPKITTIELASGRRYRFTIDTGRDPATGKRRQRRYTFARKAEAGPSWAGSPGRSPTAPTPTGGTAPLTSCATST